jgi:hypothetical protein
MSTENNEKPLMKITKKVLSGVLRLGRGAATVLGLAMLLALVLGVGTTALAAASGDPFKLGRTNTIDKISKLVGGTSAAMLRIDNNSTGPGATALDLQVEPGKPPMEVNSSTEVQGMNVDEVDGKSASEFLGYGETAFDARAVDGKSADEIGVNGLERVDDASDSKLVFPQKDDGGMSGGEGCGGNRIRHLQRKVREQSERGDERRGGQPDPPGYVRFCRSARGGAVLRRLERGRLRDLCNRTVGGRQGRNESFRVNRTVARSAIFSVTSFRGPSSVLTPGSRESVWDF